MQPDHLTFCWPPPIILIVEDFGHENTECRCVYVSAMYSMHISTCSWQFFLPGLHLSSM